MANEPRIPGVEISLEDSEMKKAAGKIIAEVKLTAHITDIELWEAVEDQFDGMKLYDSKDFQSQVNDLLRQDNEDLESALEKKNLKFREVRERSDQQASFSAQEVEELRRENQTLRARVAQLEVLERELQDLAGS